jgi:CheY-like chemotaxis protein
MASREGDPLRVLFLEDSEDLRDVVVDLLELLGATCVAVASVDDLQHVERPQDYALAILDINLGADAPSGINAYAWLRRVGFEGRVVFLTGHAQNHPLVEAATRIGDASVYAKPVSAAQLRALIGVE